MGSDNAFQNRVLGPADYVLFAIVLMVSAGIGIFFAIKGQRDAEDFLLGGRNLGVFPISMSLLASFMSAVTMLGTPAELYTYDAIYLWIILGYLIMIPLSAHCYIPIFYNLKLTSVFSYLELRFNKAMRLSCVIAYIIQTVLYTAIVLYAPSLALEAVTGFNVWAAVFSVGVVCTFYTTIGGMKAVVWTDTFQIIIMFVGLFAILAQGTIDHGGFDNIWADMKRGDRVHMWNWDPSPTARHTIWSLVIGGLFTWLPIYGVNQTQVQRAVSVNKLWKAQLALWINFPGLAALLLICGLGGMVCYAEYKYCDPLTQGRIGAKDQLLPRYVMDRLYYLKGLPGLFTASLFSGALSTISSSLNALTAVTLEDLLKDRMAKVAPKKATIISKACVIGYGIIIIALTFVAAQLGGVLQAALGIFGMIGGPQLGVYTLGIFYPFANSIGALVGFFTSLIFTLWLGCGAQVYKPIIPKSPVNISGCPVDNLTSFFDNDTTMSWSTGFETTMLPMDDFSTTMKPLHAHGWISFYDISYMWYGTLAVGVACGVGVIVSLITGPTKAKDVDPRLIYPIFERWTPCLPKKVRHYLSCCVDYDKEEVEDKEVEIAPHGMEVEQLPTDVTADDVIKKQTAMEAKAKEASTNLAFVSDEYANPNSHVHPDSYTSYL